MRATASLIRREFSAYFLSPIAYVVLVVFLSVTGYLFYRTLLLLTAEGPEGTRWPMQSMFAQERFWLVFLFIPPLLTMRLFAEERSSGTLEMLLTGKPISARRALELGLVNRVVPAAELDAAVQEFVDTILASSPLTIRLGKRAFYEQLALDEAAAYERAVAVMTENALSHDAREGMRAFLQKRSPAWTGD